MQYEGRMSGFSYEVLKERRQESWMDYSRRHRCFWLTEVRVKVRMRMRTRKFIDVLKYKILGNLGR